MGSSEDFPEALWAPAWAAEPGHTPLTPFESSIPATLHHALQPQTPSVPNIGPLHTRPFYSVASPLNADHKLHTPPNHHHHPKSSSTQHFVSTHCHYHCCYSAFSTTQIIHHLVPTSLKNTFQFDTHLEASVLNTSHIPQYPIPAPLNFTIYPSTTLYTTPLQSDIPPNLTQSPAFLLPTTELRPEHKTSHQLSITQQFQCHSNSDHHHHPWPAPLSLTATLCTTVGALLATLHLPSPATPHHHFRPPCL